MLEKTKAFLQTTTGKIIFGCALALLAACLIGGGCYIKGCIAGRKMAAVHIIK